VKSTSEIVKQRPIAYYPIYRDIAGSITGGILLSQLMYWFKIKDKFYKTDKELKRELNFTDSELRGAKRKIRDLDFISVKKEGLPAKNYYKINWEKYRTCMVKFTEPVVLNSHYQLCEIHTTITKNTYLENTYREKEKIYKKKRWKDLKKDEQERII